MNPGMRRALMMVVVLFLGREVAWGAERTGFSVNVNYATRYLWRGIPLNEEAVLQPGLGFSGNGFSLNFWGNVELTDWGERAGYGDERGNATELDFSAGWEKEVGKASLGLGFITYIFPHTGADSTTELFVKAAFALPLSPSLTFFVDEDVAEGAGYLALDLSHRFQLWEAGEKSLGLELFGHVGYANGKCVRTYYGLEKSAWHDWSLSVSFPFSLGHGFSLVPGYTYSWLIHEDLREIVKEEWDRDPESGVFFFNLVWSGER